MKEDILRYLNGPYEQAGIKYKSAYMSALIDARKITGRDENTGKIINYENTGCWAGALVYLVLIEHIGKLFRFKGVKYERNSFVTALSSFSSLSKKEIYSLFALRCSFAHNYFLFNIPKDKKDNELLMHHFTVTRGNLGNIIDLPKVGWDGKMDNLYNTVTKINLEKLGDLVEDIHSKLIDLCNDDKIDIVNEQYLGANFITYN